MLPIELNKDDFIMTVICQLKADNFFKQYINGFWIVYGSYVINEQNSQSDIDIMYIHLSDVDPFRKQFYYENIPITVYFISKRDFLRDSDGEFGGYFVGKTLNPNIIISENEDDQLFVMRCCGNFIGKFASYIADCQKKKENNEYDIASQALLGYLKLCPPYISYLIRYYVAKNKDVIWYWIRKNIKKCLLASNMIVPIEFDSYKYNISLTQDEYEKCIMEYAANFWSFGAVCHNNIRFYSYYKIKNEKYIIDNNYHEEVKIILDLLT